MLSLIVATQKCRPYLPGNHFTIVMDYQALKWLIFLCDPIRQLAQWALMLQGYDFNIQYCPGKDHSDADALSRCIYTIYQEPMLPQTSTEELHNDQNHDDKFQPLIQYLNDGTGRQMRNLCDKKVNISSVIMAFYTNNHIQGRELSFNW